MDMEYTNLGKSGLKVSRVIAGCMTFGTKTWGQWIIDNEEEVFAILKRCYDLGIRTFDTANVYSNGRSEVLLGKFLKKYNIDRSKVVILSKIYFALEESDPKFNHMTIPDDQKYEYINRCGLSRKHILDAAADSVRRLGTYMDVLQIHRLDRETPKEEIMEALHDVVKSGQARYIGASSMKAVEFAQLQFIAEKNRWTKFISMQSFYNLLHREDEHEMNYFCNDTGVGLIPWSPLATGLLARAPEEGAKTVRGSEGLFTSFLGLGTETDKKIIKRVKEIADKRGVPMAVVATAWVISKGANPILGLNSVKRVEEAAAAVKFKLTEEEIKQLEELYEPKKLPNIG